MGHLRKDLRYASGLLDPPFAMLASNTFFDSTFDVPVPLEDRNLTDTCGHSYDDTQAKRNEYCRNSGRQYFAGCRYTF